MYRRGYRRLLIVHGKVERYHLVVGRTLEAFPLYALVASLSLLFLTFVVDRLVEEASIDWMIAPLVTVLSVVTLAIPAALADWATDAYSRVVLTYCGHRAAVGVFWWYGVLWMGFAAFLLTFLTVALGAFLRLRFEEEESVVTALEVIPWAVSVIVLAAGTVATLWALRWGVWVVSGT
ncbi:hypothetical protein [Methanopyrus kandleri]